MDWRKIAPWNWFKDEESSERRVRAPARASDPLTALRNEMDRMFEDAFRRLPALPGTGEWLVALGAPLRPSVDISEGRKAYTVRAELPGVDRDDLSIEVEDRTLVLRAEKRRETEEDDEGYHCIERSYGAMQRVLSLPDDADAESIEAKFKNGVLKLRIPKHAARASRGRSIEVQTG